MISTPHGSPLKAITWCVYGCVYRRVSNYKRRFVSKRVYNEAVFIASFRTPLMEGGGGGRTRKEIKYDLHEKQVKNQKRGNVKIERKKRMKTGEKKEKRK